MTPEETAERIEKIANMIAHDLEADGDPRVVAESAMASLDVLATDVRDSA